MNRKLIYDLMMRQMSFLGHVMRKGELENFALTGNVERQEKQKETCTLDVIFNGIDIIWSF